MPTWIASGPGSDWQMAIASRICSLPSQPRSPTSSRSICPTSATGPPKPSRPRRRKYGTTSPNRPRGALLRPISPPLPSRSRRAITGRRPVMRLALEPRAPGIERVVHHHAVAQHLVVIGEDVREAERERIEAGRLRREVEPRGVGAANDNRKLLQRRVLQLVFREEGIEAAALADMA